LVIARETRRVTDDASFWRSGSLSRAV
jgi:hypothetical protein